MDSLETVRRCGGKKVPYPKVIRAVIAKLKPTPHSVEVGLADNSAFIKAVAYDGVLSGYKEGDAILVRHFQRGTSCVLIFNKTSKIIVCPAMKDIPSHLLKAAEDVVVAIGAIHGHEAATVGKGVSIEGVVVEDELPRRIKGTQSVRNMRVQDGTGVIQVALWNNKASSPV